MSENVEENSYDVEIASKNYEDSEMDYAERKPRSRERGSDKKPKTYRANSMNNFVQFRERPEVFAKYLKDEKGVDITGNFDIVKMMLVFAGLVFTGLSGWWLYNHYKNEKDNILEGKY